MRRWAIGGAILALAITIAAVLGHGAFGAAPDLSGTWRLDAAKSTMPRFGAAGGERRLGGEGRFGGEGRGHWGGPGSAMSGEGRRGPRMRLPDLVRIEQSAAGLRVSDSLGAVVSEIRTAKGKDEGADIARLKGAWHGERLEVVQDSPRGGQMTQVWELADRGRMLSVKTTMQRPGGMPAREFVRVYRREGA
jgi:hypothetical protein